MSKGSDQSHLYSGITSNTPTLSKSKIAAQARQARIEKKQEERHKLTTEVDVPLLAIEFKKEIDKLMFAPYTAGAKQEENMNDLEFRVERRARRIAVQSLLDIQKRTNNTLRKRVDVKEEAADKAAEAEMDLSTDDFNEQ